MRSETRFNNSVYALGIVFQAAFSVNELATRGRTNDQVLNALIKGLLNTRPSSTSELINPLNQWPNGFKAMHNVFSGQFHQDAQNWLNYSNGMLRIVRILLQNDTKSTRISKQLEVLGSSETVDNSAIASLYKEEISTLGSRIMVKGEGAILNNPAVSDAVRCALFAGIRYGWLWQQLGGTRLQFLLKRRQINDVLSKISV